jgi:hypothetical protein
MAGYFSFDKLITTYLVKTIYFLGFIVLTAGGVALAVWAGMRLQSGALPTRIGEYYIAAGVGALIVGNLVWRVFCENWVLLFDMHRLLASIERNAKLTEAEPGVKPASVVAEEKRESVERGVKQESAEPENKRFKVATSSVLGLSGSS